MKIPNDVKYMMKQYAELFNHCFEDELEGIYLHGSLVLGDYKPGVSDIDFITITKTRFTENELNKVSEIHSQFTKQFKNVELDGVYITSNEVGTRVDQTNGKNIHYNEGNVIYNRYFNFNPVTWYLFKEHGIHMYGPPASEFSVEIGETELRQYVLNNMNKYWEYRIKKLEAINYWHTVSKKAMNEEVEWTVLGLLRQFYTIQENGIVSKSKAGEYGIDRLEEKWHGIIREAVNIRSGAKQISAETNEIRIDKLVSLSKHLIELSNR